MIAHFDVDAFYASVAQRDDASLRGKPLAVAGSSRRAVVLTASYEARPFGVRSAMPLYRAKELCPPLTVVAPDFERYRAASKEVFSIISAHACAVEGLSLDEAFVDLGRVELPHAIEVAQRIRKRVLEQVGLRVSAGIAAQKMVAKIASDEAKPDGLRAIAPGGEAAFLKGMPATRLWGVGPKTAARLHERGVTTIGAIAALDDASAAALFGSAGRELRELARGHDDRAVEPERPTRSVSSEETFEYDVDSIETLRVYLRALSVDVASRLKAASLCAGTVGVKLKRSDFTIVQRQTSSPHVTDDVEQIFALANHCLERAMDGVERVRLLGVRAATLESAGGASQTSLFAQ